MNTQDFQRIVELEIKQREEELCDKKMALEARAEYKRIAESESPETRAHLEISATNRQFHQYETRFETQKLGVSESTPFETRQNWRGFQVILRLDNFPNVPFRGVLQKTPLCRYAVT